MEADIHGPITDRLAPNANIYDQQPFIGALSAVHGQFPDVHPDILRLSLTAIALNDAYGHARGYEDPAQMRNALNGYNGKGSTVKDLYAAVSRMLETKRKRDTSYAVTLPAVGAYKTALYTLIATPDFPESLTNVPWIEYMQQVSEGEYDQWGNPRASLKVPALTFQDWAREAGFSGSKDDKMAIRDTFPKGRRQAEIVMRPVI